MKLKINWRATFWVAGVVLVLGGIFYLAVFSPFLKIKDWWVESTNFVAQAQAQETTDGFFRQKLWRVVPLDSWLTFSGRRLASVLLAGFPEAEEVKVEKNILKGVKVSIKGRQPAAFWCQNAVAVRDALATSTLNAALPSSDECFFMDASGLLFREAPEISGTAMPTFFGQPENNLLPGDRVLASSTVSFAATLKKQLRDINIEIPGFVVAGAGNAELVVYTGENWLIYFDLERSVQSQIKVLVALLDGALKDKTAGLKYIDLRVAGKVYYR